MTIKVHREFEVDGSRDQIRKFAEQLRYVLPESWSVTNEPQSEFGVSYFAFARQKTDHVPAATLFLATRDSGAKVVNVVPQTRDSLTIDEYNQVLADFASFARPVAESLSLRLLELGEDASITRWLSDEAAQRLRSFSRAANKSTGSGHPMDFDRWADFIASAFVSGNKLPSSILARYLIEEEGWPDDRASELVSEFAFATSLLERLTEHGSITFQK